MNKIDAKTSLYGFIASPCSHSKSPLMHNRAFEYYGLNSVYLAFDVDNDNLKATLDGFKALKVKGANVSMPNKQAIIPYLDNISKRARLAGAVNTIILNDKGNYDGDLTDGYGFQETLNEKGWNIEGQDIVVLGAGGASNAIVVQLALSKANSISVYNRSDKKEFKDLLNNVSKETNCKTSFHLLTEKETLKDDLAHSYLLINTSGVGMEPYENMSLIEDDSYFHKDLKVADIIYQPETTKLLQQARDFGLETVNGKMMLLYQGALSFKLWTGKEMPIDIIKKEIGIK